MKYRVIITFAVSIAVAGCYETKEEVFPISGGEPLITGNRITCTLTNGKVVGDYAVSKTRQSGGKIQYLFADKERGSTHVAFHKIANDLYVYIARDVPRGPLTKATYGYEVFRVAADGTAHILMTDLLMDARVGKEFDVSADDDGLSVMLSGTVENVRKFLSKLATINTRSIKTCVQRTSS